MTGQDSAGSAPRVRASRGVGLALLGILAIAVVFRALYLREVADQPDYLSPGLDAGFHDWWARALVTGAWTPPAGYPDPHTNAVPFVRPPGYPYFLAGVYRLGGIHPLPIRLVQMALGVGACLLAYWIGRRWFGPFVALAWAAGMSLYWGFVYFDMELHAEGPLCFLLLAALYLLGLWRDRRALWIAAFAGVILGISALLRPNVLPLLPIAAGWMIWVCRRRPARCSGWGTAAALGAAGLLAILPATVRNYRVSREFVLISSNGGVNLYIGNNPTARGHAAGWVHEYGRFHTPNDYPALIRAVAKRVGAPVTYAEASRHFSRAAVEFSLAHPARTLELLAIKTLLYWGPVEIPNNRELNCERAVSPALAAMPLTFPRVLPWALAGIGVTLLRSRRRADSADPATFDCEIAVLALLIVAGMFLAVVPFFVAGRYRLPAVPFLLLFAAIALHALVQHTKQREFARVAVFVSVIALLFVLSRTRWVGPAPDMARWNLDRGWAFARLGEFEPALTHYRAALALVPEMANARIAAAHALRKLGRSSDAADLLSAGIDGAGVYRGEMLWQLGLIHFQQGRLDVALRNYELALEADPDLRRARRERITLLNLAGRHEEALADAQAILVEEPDDAEVRLYFGMTLQSLGRDAEAQAQIDTALRQRPDLRQIIEP